MVSWNDAAAYAAAVQACAEGGQVERAMKALTAMHRQRVRGDVRVYNSVLTCCANAKVFQPARQLLKDMPRWGITPNLRSYNAALAAAAAARRWQAALRVLEAMREAGETPDEASYGAAIAACERSRQWRSALKLLHEARGAGKLDVALLAPQRRPSWRPWPQRSCRQPPAQQAPRFHRPRGSRCRPGAPPRSRLRRRPLHQLLRQRP